jgi:hypothetical protein
MNPYPTAEDYAHRAADRLREHNAQVARHKSENTRAALVAALAEGLRGAWTATPDVFTPYAFDINEAAAALAEWIAARPR